MAVFAFVPQRYCCLFIHLTQHLKRLELVLQRLQHEGLKATLSKYLFFQQEVRYLSHVISAEGISTDPDKVEVVTSWQPRTTFLTLRSFL